MPPASTDAGAASRRSRSASLTGAPVGLRSGVQQAGGSHGCAPPTPATGIGGALGRPAPGILVEQELNAVVGAGQALHPDSQQPEAASGRGQGVEEQLDDREQVAREVGWNRQSARAGDGDEVGAARLEDDDAPAQVPRAQARRTGGSDPVGRDGRERDR